MTYDIRLLSQHNQHVIDQHNNLQANVARYRLHMDQRSLVVELEIQEIHLDGT